MKNEELRMKNEELRMKNEEFSLKHLYSDKKRAGLGGTIEITGVAELAAVEVFLERVEEVLDAAVKLEFQMMA